MKTPAERLEKAEKRARKAQRKLAAERRAANLGGQPSGAAVDLAAGAGSLTPGQASPLLPAPDEYDSHLLGKAAGGDEVARELLRRRGTDGVFASYARHVLAKSTDPGQRSYAAGVLAALDESYDEYAPAPRGAGSSW